MKAKGKKASGQPTSSNGSAVAFKHPMQEKAEKLRAAWTEDMHAAVVKKFPPAAELEASALRQVPTSKIEDIEAGLANDERRLAQDTEEYERLRKGGIEQLSDYAITQERPAVALKARLETAQTNVIRGKTEVASKRARLMELQGGLVDAPKEESSALGKAQWAAAVAQGIAKPTPEVKKKATVESKKDITWIRLPRDVLEACVLVAPQKDVRYYLNGVYIHSYEHLQKKMVRTVATNGHSLLLHSYQAGEETPPWLEDGVIMPRDMLSIALATVGKMSTKEMPHEWVNIGYAKGHAHLQLQDPLEDVTFRMRVVDGKYPDYKRVIEGAANVLTGGERAPMTGVTLDSTYVKLAISVGAKLGVTKQQGMTSFAGAQADDPSVITFINVPDVMYIIMPMRSKPADQMPTRTLALMGTGLKGTLAALKATQTRQKKLAAEEKNADRKKAMLEVIAERESRIAAVLEALNGKALAAPEPEKAPVEPVQPDAETEVDAATEHDPMAELEETETEVAAS